MTDTSLATRLRLEPDERREQILQCAVHLFGERPYSAVSTTELANEAGVTRGLIHHYFGTKRGLYLQVVRRMLVVPRIREAVVADGTIEQRVDQAIDWFLGLMAEHGQTFVRVAGAEGVGEDPEIERLLAEADDIAATSVLQALQVSASLDADPRAHAMVRAYSGLVKAAVREWVRNGTLTRDECHFLLRTSLLAIVRDTLPHLGARPTPTEKP
jgi:AcrR family transcriptional regulator